MPWRMIVRQRGLFDENERFEELTKLGDPLMILKNNIDWESFRDILNQIRLAQNPKNVNNVGRKPFDVVMMFKILILQRYYDISDEQMEFQLKDRRSFERFVSGGETLYHMPDAKTIWLYRERFKDTGIARKVFYRFDKQLKSAKIIGKSGKMIDASFVEVPTQRNSKDDNKMIKDGTIPNDWPDSKKAQKDTDARWTKKNGRSYFGYKNHIVADKKSKIILNYEASTAEVHDSQMLDKVIGYPRKEKESVWADSACRSEEIETM